VRSTCRSAKYLDVGQKVLQQLGKEFQATTNLMAQSTAAPLATAYAYKDTCILVSICISAYSESVRFRAPLLGGVHESKHQGKTTEACTAEASVAEVFIAPSWA